MGGCISGIMRPNNLIIASDLQKNILDNENIESDENNLINKAETNNNLNLKANIPINKNNENTEKNEKNETNINQNNNNINPLQTTTPQQQFIKPKNPETKTTNFTTNLYGDINNEEPKIIKAILNSTDKQNLQEIFKNHFLFKNKSPKVLSTIIDNLEMMTLPPNTLLFSTGDKGYYFYIINSGCIKLQTEYGEKHLTKNDTFGELALIQNKRRTASAKTIEKCVFYLLNGKTFREILTKYTKTELNERMNILKTSPIFNSLDNIKLNSLASGLIVCTFKPGEIILYQGDNGQSIYIIKSGLVKCYKDKKEIRILGPKDYFGEGSLLFNINRTLSVHVEETTECYQLSESFLIDTLGKEFKQVIISSISQNAFLKSKFMKSFASQVYFQIIIENCTIKSIEDNEIVIPCNQTENYAQKIYVLLLGNLIQSETGEIVASRGDLYGDSLIKYNKAPQHDIIGVDGLKLIEFDWNEITEKLDFDKKKIFSLFTKAEILRQIPLFKETQINKLISIVKLMKKVTFVENEVIFREGDKGNQLFMIKKGRVKIMKDKKFMRELGEGSCFGEVALLFDEPRTATIIALCETTMFYLTKEDFTKLIDDNMISYLAKKLSLEDGFGTLLQDLYFVKSLGQGKFGCVSLVHNNKSFFALKRVSRKAAENKKILIKYFIQERNILLVLEHPFIMKLVKTFKTDSYIFFLLEYIQGRSMSKYLNSRNVHQLKNCVETIFYIANLFVAVDYLNSRLICHRDLKPDNIIVDERGYLKLIDFGNSIKIKDFTNTITGTPHFIAPEVLMSKGYGLSCDYWSIGIIAHEVYYGNFPFGNNAKDPIEVYKEILKKDLVIIGGDPKIKKLIEALLKKKVSERVCNLEKAKKLEAFKNFNWDALNDLKIIPQYIPKKNNFKDFSEYKLKYVDYLTERESKESQDDDVLSSYDDDGDDVVYDENWADIF